ncbi:hypothetical protein WG902_08435 [Ramlibacter sp. PS3R-8]|uniref:hypothetical protein n=1 Tax=Ramlibacter sp. PS3R-8 TaxID=3133437 RepID=UPI0030A70FFE
MANPQSPQTPVSRPGHPLDLGTSVAGEEDPGASFDAPRGTEGRSDQPAGTAGSQPAAPPADEAPAKPHARA